MSNVAIVVPVYRPLTEEEKVSWRHLTRYLSSYHRILLLPDGLEAPFGGFEEARFDPRFFSSVQSYSKLLLERRFYERFRNYSHILIYQLDSLVFSDQLEYWCRSSYDYVGAPWFWVKGNSESGLSRVGNGGFSLRKVSSFLRVTNSRRYIDHSESIWRDLTGASIPDVKLSLDPQRLLKRMRILKEVRQGCKSYRRNYTLNEDHFWSDRAKLFLPEFKVAPVQAGLRFAFEQCPSFCFEQTREELPFGAHAWSRWDPAFWNQYLIN